jgi:hypothetical protein
MSTSKQDAQAARARVAEVLASGARSLMQLPLSSERHKSILISSAPSSSLAQ